MIRILLENKLRYPLKLESDLLSFFADRLKVALKEKGVRHDLIDAVFSLGGEDDLVRLCARVEALQAFLKSDDGANLLAGYKRAANILKAAEKDGRADALYGELVKLFERENVSASPETTEIPAAFLKVVVDVS